MSSLRRARVVMRREHRIVPDRVIDANVCPACAADRPGRLLVRTVYTDLLIGLSAVLSDAARVAAHTATATPGTSDKYAHGEVQAF